MNKFLSKMLYALTSAYSRKDCDNHRRDLPLETNIGKLFSILAWGLETVEEQAELVKLWDDLDYACGSVLDRYGANFGVSRVSSDDRFYRLAIKVKIMAQLSGGDTDTVIRAAAMLLDVEQSDVLLEDVFPAKIALYVDTALLSQDRQELIEPIAYAIKRILVAGVGMRLYLRSYRTYRHDLILLRCGFVDTDVSAVPVSQDRESTEVLGVNYGGLANAGVSAVPVSQDRKSTDALGVNYGGFLGAGFAPLPFSADRTAQMPVQLSCGSVQTSTAASTLPDIRRANTGRQCGAGGAVYHTRIKSKRID